MSGNNGFNNKEIYIKFIYFRIDCILKFKIETNLFNSDILIKNFKLNLDRISLFCNDLERTFLTPSDIHYVIDHDRLNFLQSDTEIDNIFFLNNLQEGFIYQYFSVDRIKDSYFNQALFEINSPIESNKLFEAWKMARKKFSALRTRFSWNDYLIQIINKYDDNTEFFKYIEFDNNLEKSEIDSEIQKLKIKDRFNYFKLDVGNLLRIYLIKINETKYNCLISYHHTILDGWSIPILTNFVYENYINNLEIKEIKDDDFNNVQKYLQLNTNYEYWKTKLNEIQENIDLKLFNRLNNDFKQLKKFNKKFFEINNEKYFKLKKLNSAFGITPNALFQFIWHKIFSIYSNTKQTIIGTTVSGRNIPVKNIENVVGCFINTLPLIVNHYNDNINIIDKIKEIQDNINELNMNSNVKLAKLQSNGEKLFDVLFVFENFPDNKNEKIDQLNIKYIETNSEIDLDFDFSINIIVYENKDYQSYIIDLNYSINFDSELIKDTILLFDYLLIQILNDPNQKVSDLNYLHL